MPPAVTVSPMRFCASSILKDAAGLSAPVGITGRKTRLKMQPAVFCAYFCFRFVAVSSISAVHTACPAAPSLYWPQPYGAALYLLWHQVSLPKSTALVQPLMCAASLELLKYLSAKQYARLHQHYSPIHGTRSVPAPRCAVLNIGSIGKNGRFPVIFARTHRSVPLHPCHISFNYLRQVFHNAADNFRLVHGINVNVFKTVSYKVNNLPQSISNTCLHYACGSSAKRSTIAR